MSGGRLELGIGWGSVTSEIAAAGLGDAAAAQRAAYFGEAVLPRLAG